MAGSTAVRVKRGFVKSYNCKKGFGFIIPEFGGPELFVQQSSIKPECRPWLNAGETVEFVVSVNHNGRPSAVSVIGFGDSHIPVCDKASYFNYGIPCYGFLGFQPISFLNPFQLKSEPPLPAKVETLVGRVSEEGIEGETEWRNWADLPGDILSIIFNKITAADILLSAQLVCKPWRQTSLEPSVWKCIELRMDKRFENMVSLAMMAVDRSDGCVEELIMESFPTDDLMDYIAVSATQLRSLHLIDGFINEKPFIKTLGNLPLLEELELSMCYFSDEIVERIGEICPQLKSFRFNARAPTSLEFFFESDSIGNTAALAIAKHFKQLRSLQLFANRLTTTGLSDILDNCPELEYLDIRYCFSVGALDKNLKNKCARIKDLRLPNDSTDDYEYGVGEFQADDYYINPLVYAAYYDFGFNYYNL